MQTNNAVPQLRFLCFGVGAIGTYLGGSLALSGQQVVFVERPAVAAEVRASGLTLDLSAAGLGVQRVENPLVVDSLEQALATGPFDVALLAVKAFDTPSVIDNLRPFLAQMPAVLSFQNGVENEPLLACVLGKERVICGTVTTAVGRKAAGSIVVERLRGIGVASDHPLGTRLQPVMDAAGLRARSYANPLAMKWSKMVTNLLANASSAILDLPPAQIFANRALFGMEVDQLRETLRVMAAQGIPVVDLPSTPVRALAFAVRYLPARLSQPLLKRAVGSGRGAKMPSFHIDLHAGRGKSEVDYLNGAVARFGKRLHIDTPVNTTLTDILQQLTDGTLPLDTYAQKPDKLLAAIPR
jgi:2-dehydropantoate 2-reductase